MRIQTDAEASDRRAREELFLALRTPATSMTEHDLARCRISRIERVVLWGLLVATISLLAIWRRAG